MHINVDIQVCFSQAAFLEPVKPSRCTTGPVEPLDGINKGVCGTKLYPTTVSACPVDWDCLCHLLDTQLGCLCLNGSLTDLKILLSIHN